MGALRHRQLFLRRDIVFGFGRGIIKVTQKGKNTPQNKAFHKVVGGIAYLWQNPERSKGGKTYKQPLRQSRAPRGFNNRKSESKKGKRKRKKEKRRKRGAAEVRETRNEVVADTVCHMQALRSHFLKHGYVVVPSAIAATHASQLESCVYSACIARRKHMLDLPLIDNIVKQTSRVADPLYDKLEKKLQQHRKRLKLLRARKRKKAGKSALGDMSGDDVWLMTQQIAASLVGKNSEGESSLSAAVGAASSSSASTARDPVLETTIETDHQMLAAINKYQANTWMTSEKVEAAIRGEQIGHTVGRLVTEIVHDEDRALSDPYLFADFPVVREPFGRSLAPSFGAPHLGVNTPILSPHSACVAWVFTADHDHLRMPIYVFENSHTYVRQQYFKKVDPNHFEVNFKPMESHTPQWLTAFKFGERVAPIPLGPIPRGSVLLCDPHLFVAAGCNFVNTPTSIMRMGVLDGSVKKASMRPPSWIRGWRSAPSDVPLYSDVVFPRLHARTK